MERAGREQKVLKGREGGAVRKSFLKGSRGPRARAHDPEFGPRARPQALAPGSKPRARAPRTLRVLYTRILGERDDIGLQAYGLEALTKLKKVCELERPFRGLEALSWTPGQRLQPRMTPLGCQGTQGQAPLGGSTC